MLEPIAEDPKVLLEHHRRQAALNHAAKDFRAAYWHGRKAQAAVRRLDRAESAGSNCTVPVKDAGEVLGIEVDSARPDGVL